jgi:nitroimidazol reductase NimA-like FMN-containing flavoprotein (pyridoxamine 5'-phosphate oxidase superfamily)
MMRRKDREITSREDIETIIRRSTVCRLAMIDGNEPYIVPLSFGYADNELYFHSARQGRKLDVLRSNNRVCFEFDIDLQVVAAERACKWGFRFQSVIGTGKAFFIDAPEAKKKALDVIMRQYTEKTFEYDERAVDKTVVFGVAIETMSGKQA